RHAYVWPHREQGPPVLRPGLHPPRTLRRRWIGGPGFRGLRVLGDRGRGQARADGRDQAPAERAWPRALRLPVATADGRDRHPCGEIQSGLTRRPADFAALSASRWWTFHQRDSAEGQFWTLTSITT